jgi:hypothetical protein
VNNFDIEYVDAKAEKHGWYVSYGGEPHLMNILFFRTMADIFTITMDETNGWYISHGEKTILICPSIQKGRSMADNFGRSKVDLLFAVYDVAKNHGLYVCYA